MEPKSSVTSKICWVFLDIFDQLILGLCQIKYILLCIFPENFINSKDFCQLLAAAFAKLVQNPTGRKLPKIFPDCTRETLWNMFHRCHKLDLEGNFRNVGMGWKKRVQNVEIAWDTKIKAQSDQGQNKEKWFKKYWQCIVNPSWRIHLFTNEMGFCSFEGFISIRPQWTFKTGGFWFKSENIFFFFFLQFNSFAFVMII